MKPSTATLQREQERIDGILARSGGERHTHVRKALNEAMSDHAFIFRNETDLAKGMDALRQVREAATTMTVQDKSKTFNTDLVGAAGDRVPGRHRRSRSCSARSTATSRAAPRRAPTSPTATTRSG